MAQSPGTVPLTGANGSSVATANPYLNGLIWGDKWGSAWTAQASATPVTVSYAFINESTSSGAQSTWTDTEKAYFRNALAQWEHVANIQFTEITSATGADASYTLTETSASGLDLADLKFDKVSAQEMLAITGDDGENNETLGIQSGPNNKRPAGLADEAGNIYYGYGLYNGGSSGWNAAALAQGGYSFVTLIHELGHGIGLAHPHDTGGVSGVFPGIDTSEPDVNPPKNQPGTHALNQGVWTTMSYRDGVVADNVLGQGVTAYGFQGTPMAFDIAAVQYIYGANTTYASGNDTYTIPDANASGTFYSSIWDTGGVDTLSYAGGTHNAALDLRAAPLTGTYAGGYLSRPQDIYGGFTIANGVTIENAVGGNANDTITGNDAANTLTANAGTDVISGGAGADALYGNDGNDTLFGNQDTDLLFGGHGNDTLFGGQGNDALYGGTGNDELVGGLGTDTLGGGDGADVFVIDSPGEGSNVITDFQSGIDRIGVVSPNFGGLPTGTLAASHFALDAPGAADQWFVFSTATGVLSYDADGSGAGAAVDIAHLNVRTLSASDITVLATA